MVERLESLLNRGRRIPIGSFILLKEDELLDIVDQMRIAVPDEVREASRIQQNRDRIIAQAREEADRIVALAQEEAFRLIGESYIVEQAKRRAQEVIGAAQEEALNLRKGADEYAAGILRCLDEELRAVTTTVQNGLAALRARQEQAEPSPQKEAMESQGREAPARDTAPQR